MSAFNAKLAIFLLKITIVGKNVLMAFTKILIQCNVFNAIKVVAKNVTNMENAMNVLINISNNKLSV